MATLFSLNDGNLTDTGVFYQTLSVGDVFDGTTMIPVLTSDFNILNFSTTEAVTISAIALHVANRAATPVGTLTVSLSTLNSSIAIQTVAISSFTPYDANNNLLSNLSQNWQIIKLSSPFPIAAGDVVTMGLKTSTSNQLSTFASDNSGVGYDAILSQKLTIVGSNVSLTTQDGFSCYRFFGSGTDRVAIPYSNVQIGTGNFTIEMFVYPISKISPYPSMLRTAPGPDTNNISVWAGHDAASQTKYHISIGGAIAISSTSNIIYGQWSHIALVRSTSDNILRFYVNGALEGSLNNYTNDLTFSANLQLGSETNGFSFNGYISQLRISKSNLYPNAFTAPSQPLPTIYSGANQSYFNMVFSKTINKALVTTTTKPAVYDILSTGTLTKNGTTLSAASPFGVGTDSSIRFNGTSDYLTAPQSSNFDFPSGTFTIEAWVRYNSGSLTAYRSIVNNYLDSSKGWALQTTNTGKLGVNFSGDGFDITGTTTLQADTWYHVAVAGSPGSYKLFLNGVQEGATFTGSTTLGGGPLYIGKIVVAGIGYDFFNGYISNLRIVNGAALYTSNFNTSAPISPLTPLDASINTVMLYKDPYNTNYNINSGTFNTLHIGGALKGLTSENRVLTASTVDVVDLYIHNQGKLVFPTDTSKTLTVRGSKGLQITSDGTLEIGTASNPISSSVQHNIILSNSHVDVHNGGNMNVYGAYKKPYTYLSSDSLSATKSFTVVDSVSTSWLSGDSVVFTPNTYQRTSFDVLTLSSFDSDTTFKTTTNAVYNHPSVTSLGNVPTVSNLSRNISIKGSSSSNRATVRAVDAAKVNITNTQFTNFGIASANKTGFVVGVNSSGYVSLSGNSFYSDGYSGTTHITTASGRSVLGNLTLKDNVFFKSGGYGVSLSSVAATGLTVTGNTVLSALNSGLYFMGVSSSGATMNNNTVIGSNSYGTFITNCTIDGDFGGAINYGNANRGLVLSADHIGNLTNLISLYNTNEGIYIDGAMPGLSSTIFSGITSNNNTSTGIEVSGNNVNAMSPIVLNMRDVVAKNNDGIGFEMYNISGNISSVYLDNNLNYGMKSSFGGETTIDGLSSFLVAGLSSATVTKNGTTLSAASPFGVGTDSSIKFNGTSDYLNVGNFSQFPLTGDFTVEFWLNFPSNPSVWYILVDTWEGSTTGVGNSQIEINPSGKLAFYYDGNSVMTGNTTITTNAWHHVAVVRSNNSIRFYIDGVLDTATPVSFSGSVFKNSYQFNIGRQSNGSTLYYKGCLSNIRIVKGTALYTSNFTSPTSPLSVIGGTAFLYRDPYGTSCNFIVYRGQSAINLGLIGGNSYYPINIKNSNIASTSSPYYGTPLELDSTNYKQFNVENTTLSSTFDAVKLKSTTDKVRGSYMFNKCMVGSSPVLGNSNYQSDVFKTTGVAFMNKNNVDNSNSTHFAAGDRSLDNAIFINAESSPSEKLKPVSTSLKLRSGSKFVALNSGESVVINVYIRKSTLATDGAAYNGNSPRLMLKRNSAMDITQDIVMDQLDTTSELFLKLSAQTPTVTNNGVLEFYVDCDGTQGFINIDNWAAI